MSATVWPDYARIRAAGHGAGADPSVRRTQFDDGEIRQEITFTELRLINSVTVTLASVDRVRFLAWCWANQNREFLFQDPRDGAWRMTRIRNGFGGIEDRQVGNVRTGPVWEVRLTLESRRRPQPSPHAVYWTGNGRRWSAAGDRWVIYI